MSLDIEDVADELGLRRGGTRDDEVLYFDPEDNDTPDMHINPQKNQWFTFAKGQNKGGGYIDLVKHVKNTGEDQARQWLAEQFPSQYSDDTEEQIERKLDAEEVLEKATELAHNTLINQKQDLKEQIEDKRLFSEKDLEKVRLGFLDEDDVAVLKQRFEDQALVDSGLFLEGDNSVFSHLKNRIIFPYLNDSHTVFMAGRALPDTEEEEDAKYKKTVTTEYNRHILYNFTEGRDDLIITEGFTDTISAMKAGYDVASPATVKFREQDQDKIKRIAKHYETVYIINDGDEAGREGALETAKHLARIGFEAQLVELDEGDDLDDWTSKNGYDIERLLDSSKSIIDMKIQDYLDEDDRAKRQTILQNEIFEFLYDWSESAVDDILQKISEETSAQMNSLKHDFNKWKEGKESELKRIPFDHFVAGEDAYRDEGSFMAARLGQRAMRKFDFVTLHDSEKLYIYKEGFYHPNAESRVRKELTNILGEEFRTSYVNETVEYIKNKSFQDRGEFKPPDLKVNLENGVFDVETQEVQPHSPADNFMFKIPYSYEPNKTCPNIMEFLEEVCNHDNQKKAKILDMMAYSLIPSMPMAKALMLIGSGSNGKTVLIEILKTLLGGKVKPYSNKSLQDFEESRFETSDLYGKLAVVDDDLPPSKIEDASTFKKITGGTDQRGEVKYGGIFDFEPYATPIYAANHVPETEDTSKGFFRRWILVDLPITFVDNPDPENPLEKEARNKQDLLDDLTSEEEMKGLLSVLLERLPRVIDDGIKYERMIPEKREVWEKHQDPVIDFLKTFVEQGVTKTEAEKEAENQNDLDYHYLREDFLYKVIGVHNREILGEVPSNRAIKEKVENSELALNIGTRTGQEPDMEKYVNSNGMARVVSGIKLTLPEKDSEEGKKIPNYIYQTIRKYKESKQSVNIVDPNSVSSKNLLETTKDYIDDNLIRESKGVHDIVAEVVSMYDGDCSEDDVIEILENLESEGYIFEPKSGRFKKL